MSKKKTIKVVFILLVIIFIILGEFYVSRIEKKNDKEILRVEARTRARQSRDSDSIIVIGTDPREEYRK